MLAVQPGQESRLQASRCFIEERMPRVRRVFERWPTGTTDVETQLDMENEGWLGQKLRRVR